MKLFKTMQNIMNKHPFTGDGALILLVAGSAFYNLRAYWYLQPPPLNAPLSITVALLVIIPLAWRWLLLTTALMFVTVIVVGLNILNMPVMNLSSIAAIISIFCAAAYGGNRRNLASTASIVIYNGGLMYNLMFSSNVAFLSIATLFNFAGLLWNLATFLAIWWFGNALRMSREQALRLNESKERLVREREKNARRAVLDKCFRILRELHDVLAHQVSVICIKAGTAYQVLKNVLTKR
jgi:signal transduction histidine kinase